MVSLYSLQPARRVEFTQYLKLVYNDKNLPNGFNYLIVDKKTKNPKKFILKKYKTFSDYGAAELKIVHKGLKQILKTYIKDIEEGELLFPNKTGKPYKSFSGEISDAFFKASGKKIGVDILRHIWISEFLSKTRTIEEKQRFAKLMGHDKITAEFYLRVDAPK